MNKTRHCSACGQPIPDLQGIIIDHERQAIARNQKIAILGEKEFGLFMCFYARFGKPVQEWVMISAMYPNSADEANYNTVAQHLYRVKRKIEPLGLMITRPHRGGRLRELKESP